jgi:hypothetical protein
VDKTLRYAPAALNNLYLAGNQKQGTLDTRNNANQFASALEENPVRALCSLIGAAADCTNFDDALAPPRAGPFSGGDAAAKPRVPEPVDRSLGGLVEVTK